MTSAKFITFEGGEGAGKSTQARRLAEQLKSCGIDIIVTREPGGSPFAEHLRSVLLSPETPPPATPLAEALVFYAARADHLAHTIEPALAAGRWVICDRFSDSTRVYQCAAGGLARDICDRLDGLVVGRFQPDLTFVLDVPASVGLARADTRRSERQQSSPTQSDDPRPDPYEARDLAFHENLRQGFLDIAATDCARCSLIDAEQSSDRIAAEIWRDVANRFALAPASPQS